MSLLRDRSAEFREAGVEPYGVSRDSPWCHVAWQQALDLNFALLSDFNGDATRAFGVAHAFGSGYADVSARSAFLVDVNTTIRGAWSYGTSEVPDLDELLAAAKDL